MATSSLTNMTVPLASDQSAPTQGLLMPKLMYRFRVNFLNFGVSFPTSELTKQVIKFDRPHVSFDEIKLPVYNSTIKLAGKYTWADVTCEIRDDAAGNVSRLVGEQLQKQLDFLEQSSASSGIDYKFVTQFEILDGGNGTNAPIVLEDWLLLGCYLHDVNYNGADYATSDALKISMTIKFDNAIQNPAGGGGVGAIIGRTTGDISTGVGVG
jgi:hypothetical protein